MKKKKVKIIYKGKKIKVSLKKLKRHAQMGEDYTRKINEMIEKRKISPC